MSFGSTWNTSINSRAKQIGFPHTITNVQFICSIVKMYFLSWLVHDNLTLPCLDRLFQVIEHIDDVLALLNLVSLVRQAERLTSKYRSL